jgi:hypothetical protein
MRTSRYLQSVRSALAEGVRPQLDLALSGDALAARRLMIVAPRRLRAHIASLAYQLRTGNPAYREIMKGAWADDARQILILHWPKQVVRRMLARADFPRPESSGRVKIYRAVMDGTVRHAVSGLCWRLSRDEAAAEAVTANRTKPRILQASVESRDIVYAGVGRNGQEIVSRRPVVSFVVEAALEPKGPSASVTSSLSAARHGRSASRTRVRRAR